MKKSALFRLALLAIVFLALQNANAGSAVAWDGVRFLGAAYGGPVAMAKQRALENCRRKGGINPWIIGSSDVSGYGAIAIARHPNGRGSLIGVALGRRSATEADTLAVEMCLKAGGTNPRVTAGFRG